LPPSVSGDVGLFDENSGSDMPRDESIIGTRSGRVESPAVELAMQEAIGDALSLLLSEKGLYQNVSVEEAVLEAFSSANRRSRIPYDQLVSEFKKRPWNPISSDATRGSGQGLAHLPAAMGSPGLGTPQDEMPLNFLLPDIETRCRNCKKPTAHGSMSVSFMYGLGSPFPVISEETGDVFVLYYACALCRSGVIVFLVKRKGYRLQLCGRSERLVVEAPKSLPKKLRPICSDAISAVRENDVHAGFYHLRTLVEHYMKRCLQLPLQQRMTGDELAAQYNETLDPRMSGGIPSVSAIYEKASVWMHARSGSESDFQLLLDEFVGHLQAKALSEKYNQP